MKRIEFKTIGTKAIALAATAAIGATVLLGGGLHSAAEGSVVKASEEIMATATAEGAARSVGNGGAEASARRINYNLPGIPSRNISTYRQRSVVYGNKKLNSPALVVNDIIYVNLREVASTVAGADYTYNKNTKRATVSARGLLLTATDLGYVIYANDRPQFSFSPVFSTSGGEVYVPAAVLERALGIKRAGLTSSEIRYTGEYKPLAAAKNYYREDEVYWLAKIISAESSGEALLGQIAVGDVILNRVKSNLFPNTIYSVIFDKKYGVQFSPTADGRIYANPTYTATLAAKICLEGISLSDDAMYFLNPRTAQSNWIVKNKRYVYTIGNHDFYA